MLILSSSGFLIKEKCGDLIKLVQNRKVFIAMNGVDASSLKTYLAKIEESLKDIPARLESGYLTVDNIFKYADYYDCIYISGGNLRRLSEMATNIQDGLLNFVKKGKTLITESLGSLIFTDSLEYLNLITKSLEREDKIYKNINYLSIKTLSLTNEKIIMHEDLLSPTFYGACHMIEKRKNIKLTFLKDGDFLVI